MQLTALVELSTFTGLKERSLLWVETSPLEMQLGKMVGMLCCGWAVETGISA